jgi:hypothetical protein
MSVKGLNLIIPEKAMHRSKVLSAFCGKLPVARYYPTPASSMWDLSPSGAGR